MVRKIVISTITRALEDNTTPPVSKDVDYPPATFEEAISSTGFGRFNYLLLLMALPANWAGMITVFNTAYVIPALQCDFNLDIMDIGILNASPFIGNIPGAFVWGYLADTMGRKKLMIYGNLADAILNILCAFSVNMWMVAILKFLSGFTILGPTAILMSYLSECHSDKYRSRVILISGIFMGFVNLFMPLLAWAVLPRDINFIHPWQLFFLLCTIPGIITGLIFTILPESPKFLMLQGKHDEALKDGWRQIKPLFYRPYLGSACLVLSIQFCTLLGSNTLKLWLPQLFTIVDDYDQVIGSNKGDRASICEIINFSHKTTNVSNIKIETTCTGIVSNDQVYINSGIVGVCTILMYVIVALIINKVSKKTILVLLYVISGGCGLELIWATNPRMMLAMSSVYTAMTGVACVTLISVVVELFPTSLRTMTVSLTMMMGRVGTIIGNVIFPLLLVTGCLPPFLLIGGIILTCLPLLFLLSSPTEEDFK